ncbi:MAG: hypothetical protein ABIJ35_12950, partial [Acidobacteriota bacterium]
MKIIYTTEIRKCKEEILFTPKREAYFFLTLLEVDRERPALLDREEEPARALAELEVEREGVLTRALEELEVERDGVLTRAEDVDRLGVERTVRELVLDLEGVLTREVEVERDGVL